MLKASLWFAAIGLGLSAMSVQADVIVSDNFTEDTPGNAPGLHPTDADSPWTFLGTTGTGAGSTAVVELAAAASDPFGVAGNNYLKLVSPAADTGLNFRSVERFDENLLTISFDVHEPTDGGSGNLNFQLYDDGTSLYNFTINNGNIGGIANAYTVGNDAHVDMIVNGTGASVTHKDESIADGSLGLWVDGSYKGTISGFAAAPGANVNDLRFVMFNGVTQTLLIDNFQVSDEAVVIPEPGSLALLFAGALAAGMPRRIRG